MKDKQKKDNREREIEADTKIQTDQVKRKRESQLKLSGSVCLAASDNFLFLPSVASRRVAVARRRRMQNVIISPLSLSTSIVMEHESVTSSLSLSYSILLLSQLLVNTHTLA